MNLTEHDIERVLRKAPQPQVPATLKARLVAQVALPRPDTDSIRTGPSLSISGWLRRWWPALAPASVSLACTAMIITRQLEVRDLRQANAHLAEQCTTLRIAAAAASRPQDEGVVDAAVAEEKEIARLKEQAATLTTDVARLEKIQAENETLRKQPIAAAGLTAEELEAVAQAREKAMSITCVNNLKQIGLAVRMWAMDHKDVFPSDFLSISNELNTPKILVCPGDTGRRAAATFGTFTDANCSYEFVAPLGNENEPNRVVTRCPIHGSVGLCDGSVQREVGKNHPEWLLQRDGKLYLKSNP